MPFQSTVNVQPAPAVAGDFASTNPRFTVDAGPGGLVAGSGGVTVGLFAWAASSGSTDPSTGETDAYNTVTNAGSGAPTGFVARTQQGLITAYLAEASMVIPQGQPVTLFSGGDFWVKNTGAGAVTAGQKAFASNTTGAIQFAAAGATVAGNTETKFYAMSVGAAGELVKISDHPLG